MGYVSYTKNSINISKLNGIEDASIRLNIEDSELVNEKSFKESH
jgi:hypothetical protein